jgi:UDP-N-acetylmuramoyl-tripeptide--D-alanyl-D-alanine ligase
MLLNIYQAFLASKGISTDTRKIEPGNIFFALKGPSFNGNQFALQALEQGASFAVIDEPQQHADNRLLLVDDVLLTLQKLAHHHRKQFNIPVIALTGSNGKTTTKELISKVLSTTYSVLSTQGNLNNHIGVPITLLQLKHHHQMAIIEMGANHQGEIAMLCDIAVPTHGLITNIGKAHLEGFGGIEGVLKGKTEMYHFLKRTEGLIFCRKNDLKLMKECIGYKNVVFYSTEKGDDLFGTIEQAYPFLKVVWNLHDAHFIANTQLTGEYNLENILSAICIGLHFNVSADNINSALSNYVPDNQRSQLFKYQTNTIIMDAYNANPTSMEAALKNIAENYDGNKVLILGEMLELGNETKYEHQHILDMVNQMEKDQLILVGTNFLQATLEEPALRFGNSADAAAFLMQHPVKDSIILIKGSRGSRMEKILDAFIVNKHN